MSSWLRGGRERGECGSFFFFVVGDQFGFGFLWPEGVGGEGGLGAAEFCGRAAHLAIEGPPLRIDDPCGVRNRCGPVLNQTVDSVVLAHIFEIVFLIPSGEHGCRAAAQGAFIIGAQNGGLVAVFTQMPDLAHPESVAQTGAAFGEFECAGFAVGVLDGLIRELFGCPVLAGVFVIGEDGNALGHVRQ